jgi:hypothetical protein
MDILELDDSESVLFQEFVSKEDVRGHSMRADTSASSRYSAM